jgi:exodeoxyribonuclease V gamma subunit
VDRHLFLEALLSARDALLLFGCGFEPVRGARVPLSVVVTELLEVVAAGVGREPDALLVRHPLQPWSQGASPDERRRSFASVWVDAAQSMTGTGLAAGLAATRRDAPWPAETHRPRELSAVGLAAALARPQEELLKLRLGLALAPKDAVVADREPLEQDTLEAWVVRDRVLHALESQVSLDVAALETRLRAEGSLPLRAAGRLALEECLRAAQDARRRASSVAGTAGEPLQLSLDVNFVRVTGLAGDVRFDGAGHRLVWVTASPTPSSRALLVGWITLLLAVASGVACHGAHVVGCKETLELKPPKTPDEAQGHLSALVETWMRVRSGPLPLFPSLSPAVAQVSLQHPVAGATSVLEAASAEWEGAARRTGDRRDPWVFPLFGHLTTDDLAADAPLIVDVANLVWRPLFEAKVQRRKTTVDASPGADEEAG